MPRFPSANAIGGFQMFLCYGNATPMRAKKFCIMADVRSNGGLKHWDRSSFDYVKSMKLLMEFLYVGINVARECVD